MPTLEELLTKQDVHIGQISRAITNLKKIGVGNYTASKVKHRLGALETLWEKTQLVNVQLLQIATEEDKKQLEYFKRDLFLDAEDAYLAASDYMAEIIDSLATTPMTSGDASAINATTALTSVTKLNRIDLPTFSGDRLEWEHFRDMFESLVVNNPSLSHVSRLHYLKANLKGDAAALLRNFKITETNFETDY